MRFLQLLRIPSVLLSLLILVSLLLLACDDLGDETTTSATALTSTTASSASSATTTEATTSTSSGHTESMTVEVPDVIGMGWSDAEAELASRGLESTDYPVPSFTYTGSVVEQDPLGGAMVPEGTTVQLGVQRYAFELANLVGMTEEQFEAYCEDPHLYREITYVDVISAEDVDKVLTQDPAPGTVVMEAISYVAVTIGVVPTIPTITIPGDLHPVPSLPSFP